MAFMRPSNESTEPVSGTTTRSANPDREVRPTKRHRRPLEPIGPEKLRRLRTSILNGTYPLDEAVIGGLARMFLGSSAERRDEKDAR
jgi:hypothetical protein